jgi:hypothetical protein
LDSLLNQNSAFLYILLQFLLYFPSGFLVLNGKIRSLPVIVKFPIYISFGLIITTIVLSMIGIVYIGSAGFIAYGIISYGLLIFRLHKSNSGFNIFKFFSSIKPKPSEYVPYFASVLVFVFIIIHFSLVAGYMGWPPAGDASNHGLLISILVHNHRLQTTLAPIAPSEPWFEPFGLHVMSANLSLLFGLFPGEGLFILATAIVILILLLIYSLVYFLTRSTTFSILALTSGFYIYPGSNLEYWLLGYYYNGTYANLFGYLALLVFMACVFVIFNGYRKDIKFKLIVLISILGIGITYTPLAILPFLYISSWYIFHLRYRFKAALHLLHRFFYIPNFHKLEEKTDDQVFHQMSRSNISIKPRQMIIIGILLVLSIAFLIHFENTGFHEIIWVITKIIQAVNSLSSGYNLKPIDLFTDFTGFILTCLTMLLAGISLIKRNRWNLSIFYLLFSGSILLSTWNITADYMWFILSKRLFPLLIIIDTIMLSTYTGDFVSWSANKISLKSINRKYINCMNVLHTSRAAISLVLISILFLSPFISHIRLEQANIWGWFPRSDWFRMDYDLLAWISHNINSSALLMTDYSFTSSFIYSFSFKNVTAKWYPDSPIEYERAKDSTITWNRPELLRQFIDKYDVKYIVLNSEWNYLDIPGIGGEGLFHPKRFDVFQYSEIFSRMPFLKIVKQVGPSAVYEVVK